MTRSVRDLQHVAVNASDGRVGVVEQVYFDDQRWTIRYLVVDTDQEFADRRVLVSPMAVLRQGGQPADVLSVKLTRKQVAESPDIDTDRPVSRQKELELSRYYVLPSYWDGSGLWGAWNMPEELVRLVTQESQTPGATDDVHLRSSREVLAYRVRAADGKLGHVEDFLFDDSTWRIRFLEVDTRAWIGGRHVLVSPSWAKTISWPDRTISLDLSREAVRTAPEYLSLADLTKEYEKRMREHYARPAE